MTIKKTIALSIIAGLLLVGISAQAEETGAKAETHVKATTRPTPPPRNLNLQNKKLELERRDEHASTSNQMKGKGLGLGLMKERNFHIASTSPFRLASTTLHKREEVKGKLKTEKNKNIAGRVNNFIDRLGKVIDRLIAIGTKLETRIDKMEENGVDLTKSEELLADFKVKIDVAKTDVASVSAEIETILSGEIGKDTGKKVKEAIKKAEDSVRAAHRALVLTIASVKSNIKDKPSPSPTPTPTTAVTPTPTPTLSPSPTPTPSVPPVVTPSPTPTVTFSPSPTPTI